MACICSDRLLPCLVQEAPRIPAPFETPLWIDTSLQYEMPAEAFSVFPGLDGASQRILHIVQQTDVQTDSRTAEMDLIDMLDDLHTEFQVPEVVSVRSSVSTSGYSPSERCEQLGIEAEQPTKPASDHHRAIMEIYDWLHDVTEVTGSLARCSDSSDNVTSSPESTPQDVSFSPEVLRRDIILPTTPQMSTPVKRKRGCREMHHVTQLEYGMKRRRYEMTSSSPSTWHSRNY